MRILMVIPEKFYSTRGTPLSAYHRIKDLLALGHEVEALTYAVGDPPPDLPIVVHRAAGPHFAADLAQGPSYLKIWFDALLLVHLVRLLRRGRFDALYAHEEGGFLCAMLLPWCRLPLIYDMHSSLPLQIRDWKFSDREWVVSAFRFVERFTLARSAAVVAISTAVAEAARSCAPDVPVEVIVNRFDVPTPVRPEEAARLRADLGIGASESVVLYAGSFVALQSLDLLIGAVPAVARAVPSARFVLVGGSRRRWTKLVGSWRASGRPIACRSFPCASRRRSQPSSRRRTFSCRRESKGSIRRASCSPTSSPADPWSPPTAPSTTRSSIARARSSRLPTPRGSLRGSSPL